MSRLEFAITHRYDEIPALRVVLHHNGRSAETVALVDTGATYSVFDTSFAAELDIDLSGPPYQDIIGFEVRRVRCYRRSLYVALYAGPVHVRTTAATVLFLPDIGVVSNVIGRDLMAGLPFAMIHDREELHLGLTNG